MRPPFQGDCVWPIWRRVTNPPDSHLRLSEITYVDPIFWMVEVDYPFHGPVILTVMYRDRRTNHGYAPVKYVTISNRKRIRSRIYRHMNLLKAELPVLEVLRVL